jgi:hypothetical protein
MDGSFRDELYFIFDQFPNSHMNIMLREFSY